MQKAHNTDECVIGEVEIQCLIFVYFVNDTTHIPTLLDQWQGALELEKNCWVLPVVAMRRFIPYTMLYGIPPVP
jgi:hypothetical protein